MFTGIITGMGSLGEILTKANGGVVVGVETPWDCEAIPLGASMSCSGICLTVTDRTKQQFSADISTETLEVSTAKHWRQGDKINLERALAVGDELGGHIVSGHVDGVAEIVDVKEAGEGHCLKLRMPKTVAPLVAKKGSVAIDGVSLTVNEVEGDFFEVMIIPHTWTHTTLGERSVGDMVNIESDMFARYVSRIVSYGGD